MFGKCMFIGQLLSTTTMVVFGVLFVMPSSPLKHHMRSGVWLIVIGIIGFCLGVCFGLGGCKDPYRHTQGIETYRDGIPIRGPDGRSDGGGGDGGGGGGDGGGGGGGG